MKNTIIINLFGGPGTGKSTGAAYIFSQLKLAGIDCEYVSEFAKDKVWEDNSEVFKNQFYVTGKQAFKISRCFGKVDVIITDSPILLGALYAPITSPKLKEAIMEEFDKYGDSNVNIFLKRIKPYNANGRFQTEDEAKDVDVSIKKFLDDRRYEYDVYDGTKDGYEEIVGRIIGSQGIQEALVNA